ncbi:TPA: hypothetical protein TUM69_001655 [Streptococcus equi subsp. zooepidemicus]|nr:hypothetical protein [Streptococcus equi subsp. zooepidemicus]HEL0429292.1 hypothetical protein [Streptococcus equi subsp. zooepidemicus]HEL0431427.1 hypothetical protein [Streptococcus equi subsp. zooepidemicus]HEL0435552.1 hypothetical protein [Streptococcus equi subsp. zooepidemicus]HEL0439664.1 hypothetical protein [Streptococcus equi subsp. zooepidemicus]
MSLKVKTLADFIEDVIQKYEIRETKNIRKTLRAKFFRELTNMGEWEKAKSRTIGRNRTRVFQYEVLDKLEKKCQKYLIKQSGYDPVKFKEYQQSLQGGEEYSEEEIAKLEEKIQSDRVFRKWAGSISKSEIMEVMIKALFEKFFTPIDLEQWQRDSDFLTIVDSDDERIESFDYFKAKERYQSYNKSAYYKEKKSE